MLSIVIRLRKESFIYRLRKDEHQNFMKWVRDHPLIIEIQSQRLEQFDKKRKVFNDNSQYQENIQILPESATIKITIIADNIIGRIIALLITYKYLYKEKQ